VGSNINQAAPAQTQATRTPAIVAGVCIVLLGVAFKVFFSSSRALGTAVMLLLGITGAAMVVWALTWPAAGSPGNSSATRTANVSIEAAQGGTEAGAAEWRGADPRDADPRGVVVRAEAARGAIPHGGLAVPQRRDQADASPFRPPPDQMDTFEQRLIAQGTDPDLLEGPRAGLGYRRAPLPGGRAPLAASALMRAPENSNMDEATFTEYMRQMNGEMPNQFYQAHPFYTFNANWDTRSQITDDQEHFGISSSPGQMNRKWKYKDARLQQAGARTSHLKDPPPGAVPPLDKTHPWLERDESGTDSPASMVTPLAAVAERAVAAASSSSVEIEEMPDERAEPGARHARQASQCQRRKRQTLAIPPANRPDRGLDDTTGAVEHHLAVGTGGNLAGPVDLGEIQDRVVRAADEQSRNTDCLGGRRPHDLPVAVEVAVPVQRTGEAGTGELPHVVLEVVVGQPVRQPVGFGEPVDEILGSRCGHPHGGRLVPAGPHPAQHPAHGAVRVCGHLGIGHTRLLEIQNVEEVIAENPPEGLGRRSQRAGYRRHAQTGHRGDPVRMQQRRTPGHHRTPVVPDDRTPPRTGPIQQGHQISGQRGDVVSLDRPRPRGPAVSALVGRQHPVPGRGQHRHLVAPGERQFGEAVRQDHHRAVRRPSLEHPQPDPVDVGEREYVHGAQPSTAERLRRTAGSGLANHSMTRNPGGPVG
jgi:hypothetical protein